MKAIKKISKWFWEKDDIVQIILIWFYAIIVGCITNTISYLVFPIVVLVAFILLLGFGVIVLLMRMRIDIEKEIEEE